MTNIKSRIAGTASALAMLFALPACAQTQQLPTAQADASVAVAAVEAEQTGPALWQLSDEDTTIYLFGTVHALPKDTVWYSGEIAEALGSSEKLVTEIMMTPDAEAATQQIVMSKAILPTGTTLRSMLDDKQKATYDEAMGKIGLPVSAFDQFEPWFAALNLAMLPLMKEGYDPNSGVEKILETKAGPDMARGELETVEFQMSVFDELPVESQIKFLVETADSVDTIKATLDAMVVEWVEGDAESLGKLMNESMTDPVIADRLLYARNSNWAEWIDNRMDAPGTIFIAVGAGHLAGEKSVQDMLETRGFTISRVQ